MATKHTPGPWEAQPPRLGAAITIYAGDTPIATTASNTSPLTMEMHRRGEIKANARLVAAAPELLAALEAWQAVCDRIVDQYDGVVAGVDFAALGRANRAAIAKATD